MFLVELDALLVPNLFPDFFKFGSRRDIGAISGPEFGSPFHIHIVGVVAGDFFKGVEGKLET